MIFEHQSYTQRVVFGAGTARTRLAAEVERHGAHRVLLVAAPSAREQAASLTASLPMAGVVDEVRMHVPVEVADAARRRAEETGADLLLAVGGGSATGTAKAVALSSGLPIVAVPTTYAGSEVTPVWGLTDDGRKTTGVDERVLPRTVIYDPALTLSLPVEMSIASGLNALAHCVDSLWAPRVNPVDTALALEAAHALAEGLPRVHADPAALEGRSSTLYGAYLGALAFAGAGSGLHHKICHVLGGAYDLPHAQTHAVVLPHVLAFNAPAAPREAARLARALDAPDARAALDALYTAVEAPRSLRALGLPEDRLPEAAALIAEAAPPSNPRPVTEADALAILKAAF
ncbi:maleylacetate reductase [Actinoplanes sp. NPDC051411]|uniref:maleylacetate reductase n=1 Tax=Actinoplanes sp. NPDC051411 TaxID=3155522 RepID=UPI0034160508